MRRDRGMCWCGAPIETVRAGKRIDEQGSPTVLWRTCARNHTSGVEKIPQNLGSSR